MTLKGLENSSSSPISSKGSARNAWAAVTSGSICFCPVIIVRGKPLLFATHQLKGPSYKALKQRRPYLRTEGTLREGEPKQGEVSLVAVAETSPNFGSSEYLLRSRHLTGLRWLPRGHTETSLFFFLEKLLVMLGHVM